MKEEIEDMKDSILRIAQSKPHTRDCYWMLYMEYLLDREIAYLSKQGGYYIPFKHIEDMPSTESVSRTFRKLCESHPEIRPTKPVQEFREQNEVEMTAINEWFPVSDGSHIKQSCLFMD
jgi:hypothetical protein